LDRKYFYAHEFPADFTVWNVPVYK
jgi:hypothetical protein